MSDCPLCGNPLFEDCVLGGEDTTIEDVVEWTANCCCGFCAGFNHMEQWVCIGNRYYLAPMSSAGSLSIAAKIYRAGGRVEWPVWAQWEHPRALLIPF